MNLTDVLSPITTIAEAVSAAVSGWFQSDEERTKAKAAISLALQQSGAVQAMVTLAEAQSEDKFKSRWRPFIGWICGVGLGLHAIVFPIVQGVLSAFAITWVAPTIDVSLLYGLVTTLLGMGAARTVEKIMGAE